MRSTSPSTRARWSSDRPPVNLTFEGEIWLWKGPAPWHFITVPEEECDHLRATSPAVS